MAQTYGHGDSMTNSAQRGQIGGNLTFFLPLLNQNRNGIWRIIVCDMINDKFEPTAQLA